MKKFTLIIAAVLACSMFAGCENNTSSGDSSNNGSTPVSLNGSTASNPESNSEDVSDSDISVDVTFNNISNLTEKLLDEVEFPSMVNVKANNLETYYGFTEDDVKAFSSYICGSGAMPDEFGIFIAASDEAAEKIKDALNKRIESQKTTYGDYTPNEMYKFDDCFVSVNGTTVIYAICADNDKAKELLG